MDIDNFLMTKLFEFYEQKNIVTGSSYLEYDSKFMRQNGTKMEEKEYFFKHRRDFMDDELLDALYYYIISGVNMPVSLDRIVSYLVNNYYIYQFNPNSPVIRFFQDNDFVSVKRLFIENESFGIDLLKSYLKNLGFSKKYDFQKRKALEYDSKTYDKFYNIYSIVSVKTLSDISREVVLNLFHHYLEIGTGKEDALDCVWEYFINDFDPLMELESYGIRNVSKVFYKRLMLGSIIGDVYEDVCNHPVIITETYDDRVARVLPVIISSTGFIGIPDDRNTRNKILDHFILLQGFGDKRKINRDVTYQEERIPILKKVNPLYKLDELTFLK